MKFGRENLDQILVPAGLIILLGYHLSLLYRILKHPNTTAIGHEIHNKKVWVERMMADSENIGLAVSVISSNVSTSTSLASTSLALCSLIGAWAGSTNKNFTTNLIYGDRRLQTISIKFICIFCFFLLAFASFVQSARYYAHSNFLISTPYTDVAVKYVYSEVLRGCHFWAFGLRALYFATAMLLWIFGPIPMFACSVIMVIILCYVDSTSTPLHSYQHPPGRSILKKIREEMKTAVETTETHGRNHDSQD